ncbi:hypothetical protein ACFQX4_17135 [Roseomonas sp. GCM10028921]
MAVIGVAASAFLLIGLLAGAKTVEALIGGLRERDLDVLLAAALYGSTALRRMILERVGFDAETHTLLGEGASAWELAARFAVNASVVMELVRAMRPIGSTAPTKIGHRKPSLAEQEAFLRELRTGRKGITLAEIRTALIERAVAPISVMTIWTMLKRLEPLHKRRSGPGVSFRRLCCFVEVKT